MNIGAIITVTGEAGSQSTRVNSRFGKISKSLRDSPATCCEILGQTLLQHTLQNLSSQGVLLHSVLFEEADSQGAFLSRTSLSGGFYLAWEQAVSQQMNDGVDAIVLIRLGAYLEIDFTNLLRFHFETSSALTQVYDHKTTFDVAVVSTRELRAPNESSYRTRLSALIPYHNRYIFRGYSNRLREPQDFRQLVRDALFRRNAIRPVGKQIRPDVWLGDGAKIDPTATLSAPVYIGAGSRIQGGCTVQCATAVERDCDIDFGTTLTDSSILPGTYVGVGLNVANSIVAPGEIFNLRRNVKVDISDRKLIGSKKKAGSFLGFTKAIGASGFFRQAPVKLTDEGSHRYKQAQHELAPRGNS